jgi:hypothetical protein
VNSFTLAWFVVMAGGRLLAPELYERAESGDQKVCRKNVVMSGLALSALYATTMVGNGPISRGWLPHLIMLPLCLIMGFLSVVGIFAMFKPNERVKPTILFKRFRAGSIFGMYFAITQAIVCFPLVLSLRHFPIEEEIIYSSLLPLMAGAVVGAMFGAWRIGQLKRWMIGEKIFIPLLPSDQSPQASLHVFLIMVLLVGALALLSKLAAHPEVAQIAVLLGCLPGFFVYRFIWVLIYEKRHNVRLTIEYSDPELPAEAAAG